MPEYICREVPGGCRFDVFVAGLMYGLAHLAVERSFHHNIASRDAANDGKSKKQRREG